MAQPRDPVSEWFDQAARRYLARAYRNREHWTGIYVAPPTLENRARAARMGIWDLGELDRWGEVRWVRAFKRSCYWNLKRYGYHEGLRPEQPRTATYPAVALEWETGQRVYKTGWAARRWAVRVAIHDRDTASYRRAVDNPARPWAGTQWQSQPADRDYGHEGG